MKPLPALFAMVVLSACGASGRWAATEVDLPSEAAAAGAAPGDLPIAAGEGSVETTVGAGEVSTAVSAVDDTTTATRSAAPPATTTTTSVPEIDLDLSDLDGLIVELDRLLGDLGAAMSQTEGEFTP